MHLQKLLSHWSGAGYEQHKVVVFARPESRPLLEPCCQRPLTFVDSGPSGSSPVSKLIWEQRELPRLVHDFRADVLFCPGNIVPMGCRIPIVAVIRNAAPYSSAVSPNSMGLYGWSRCMAMRPLLSMAARRSTRIIFPSRFLMKQFRQHTRFPAERSDVIYHGRPKVKESLIPPERTERPYALCVSHLYRYKKLEVLIDAWSAARADLGDLRLLIVGKSPFPAYRRKLENLIKRLGAVDTILLHDPVPHAEVERLLLGCEFFVFQSTVENCPNSLIEAITAGTAVLCSSAASMPEIAGDAALYFDPTDTDQIAGALRMVAGSVRLRSELRGRALRRAEQFPTWAQTARCTYECLVKAVSTSC